MPACPLARRARRGAALACVTALATAAPAPALAAPPERPPPEGAPPPPPDPEGRVTLRGVLLDGRTGKPIRGATLTADGEDAGTTDAAGRYEIDVAATATVVVDRDGYEPLLVDVAAAARAGELVLLPLGAASEVIELGGEPPPAAAGAARLQREELARLPGTGGDLLAGLDVLPGVTGTSGFGGPQGGLVIRGSAPEDSKILIDGFEVPLLYHALAQRSILPTAAIEGIEYLPGGFDVAFGRASSGVVSVTTRGAGPTAAGEAEVAVIDGGVVGGGPLGKRGRVLVAVRRSVIDTILPSLLPSDLDLSLTTVPRFWDGQLRLDTQLSPRWRASLSALGATDTLELFADDERDPDVRFFTDSRFVRVTAAARYYSKPWSAEIAASGLAQGLTFELGRDQYFDTEKYSGGVRAELTRTAARASGLTNVVARAGAELDVSRQRLDLVLPRPTDEGQPDAGDITGRSSELMFNGTVVSPNLGAWLATAADLDPRIRFTGGLRFDAFLRSGHTALQPRGEIAVKLARETKLRLAAGAYRRPAENEDELLDDTLAPERSTQLVLGLERPLGAGLKVQASAYYTDRRALLTRTMDGSYENQGSGTTYGGELLATLRRGRWFGWLSYSYSRSTRRDEPGAEERLFDYDQPHDLNAVLSWKGKRWQIGGRLQYTSGQPTTPVLGSIYDSDDDRFSALYGRTNSERLPGHYQIDFRIDRTWTVGRRIKLSAFLDVQNATLNAKVEGYTYNYDYSEREELTGLPILPSIGLRGEL